MCLNIAVGIVADYGLDSRGVGVHVLVGANFCPFHIVDTSSGVLPASYPKGTRDSFPGDKSGQGVMLTTYFQLLPMFRIPGSVHPLLICLRGVVLN
jgi:hypothetical protein